MPRPFAARRECHLGDALNRQFPDRRHRPAADLFAPMANGGTSLVGGVRRTRMTRPSLLQDAPLFQCDGRRRRARDQRRDRDGPGRDRRVLLDGNFRCPAGSRCPGTPRSEGPGVAHDHGRDHGESGGSGYLPITTERRNINIVGFTMRGNAFVMVTRSHVRVQDVRATCIDLDGNWHKASGNGMFFVWVAPPVDVIDDVEFYECHVVWCPHPRLQHEPGLQRRGRARHHEHPVPQLPRRGLRYGVAGDPGITAPVTSANQSRSEWITGFDFHEWQDLDQLRGRQLRGLGQLGVRVPPRARRPVRRATARTSAPDGLEEHPLPELHQLGQRPAEHLREPLLHVRLLPLARHPPRELPVPQQPERGVSTSTAEQTAPSPAARTTAAPTAGRSARRARTSRSPTAPPRTTRAGPSGSRSRSASRVTTSSTPTSSETGDTRTSWGGTRTRRSTSSRSRTPSFEITAIGNGMPIINQAGSGNTYVLSYG